MSLVFRRVGLIRVIVDPKADASDLEVVFGGGHPRRLAESPAEGIVIGARAGVKRPVASEDLHGLPAAMADREVVYVKSRDAPVGPDLDRVIADGDPVRCAQFWASDERVPAASPVGAASKVARVKRPGASEDLRSVSVAMADREVVVVHCCNPPVVANLDLAVAN